MRKSAVVSCSECNARNYTVSKSVKTNGIRYEANKFCKHCNKQTLHRETI